MLAFLNFAPSELLLCAVVAVLVFGRRLPEVAGQAAGVLHKLRRSLDELRRESGIDREIANARRSFHETARAADWRNHVPSERPRLSPGGESAGPPAPAVPPSATAAPGLPPTPSDGGEARAGTASNEPSGVGERPADGAPSAPEAS